MAERKLEVKILGDSRDLERAFGRASGSAKRFDRNMSGIGRAAAGLSKAFAVAAAGVTAIAVVGAREMQEQAKVSAQTAVVLRNVAKSAGITTQQVENLASALQASSGAADDEVQSASNVILRFGLITKTGKAAEGQLRELTTTALDLSMATGKDLTSSAQALGRALASPEKAAGALRRAGIILTDQQREQVKAMVESGNAAGAQAMVLGLVQQRVKGSAQAFGNTLPGQVERAKRAFEDLSENTLAALAPALSEIVPVLVTAIQGIAPVIARVGIVIAKLANDLISNPAFREFAATLRDIVVQGVEALANALRTVLPIVVAILAPIATLAAALLRSKAAMTVLTAAVAAFIALRATAYIAGMVTAFRALAITQTAASGMRALTTATSALAFGFRGVSAQAVGLAPGLTAAAGGVTRMGVAANAAKGIVPGLGRALSGALGGPVGIAVTATAALATVIGGDLISSFSRSKDPAQRYADAMREAADGTKAAKDSLEGLADTLLGNADAQDRTREATAGRVKAERELRTLEAAGIRSGPQYEAAVKNVSTARREEARSTLAARDATDLMQQKQNEARGTVAGLVQSLGNARSNAMAGAQALTGFGLSTGQARGQYAQFAAVANGKIMASGELKKFQDQATTMAGVFRNIGTPSATAIANALDNVGKARTPDGVSKWAGVLVGLLGGSKREVEAAKKAMNKDLQNVGDVSPSTTFFSGLSSQISSLMGDLESLARRIADVARKRAKGGKGENAREMASAGPGPNAMSWFYSQRSGAAGAARGLSDLARQGFISRDPEAQLIAGRRAQRKKDADDLTKRELQKRIAEAETNDDRLRAQMEYDEFVDALEMERVEKSADAHAQSIDDLASEFERGKISAEEFQRRLNELTGGTTGESNGKLFGEKWIAAFELALGSGSQLQAIIANALGKAIGAQPVEGPPPEAAPEPPAYETYEKRLKDWTKKYTDYSNHLFRSNPGWFRRDGTPTPAGGQRMAALLRRWTADNPMPTAALGGITRGMTIAGEAGPEAIIPLTGTRGRSYMARVMDEVGRRGGSGAVVVNVNGNEFSAEEFARKIGPELRRQIALTGSY
jgi:hypothetical protein